MIEQTRDALRAALRTAFPISDVPQLHLAAVPAGFTRPALYLEMIPMNHQRLSADLHGYLVRWQVVYFPREDSVGNAMYQDLHSAAGKLDALLTRCDSLTSPNGQVWAVTGEAPRISDDLVFCTVSLRQALLRTPDDTPKLGGVEIGIALGDGKDDKNE